MVITFVEPTKSTTTVQLVRQAIAHNLINHFQLMIERYIKDDDSPFVIIDGTVYLRGQMETWEISNNSATTLKYPIKTVSTLELVAHE